MAYNLGYVSTDYNLGYTGAFTAGPGLTADASTVEGQATSLFLTGNIAAPTEARLNGSVLTLTDATGGEFTFTAPLLPDPTSGIVATLQVDVDGFTKTVDIAYTNTFPYNPEHGEPDALSVLFGVELASTQPYELKITSEPDPAVMTVDWAQIEADGAWLLDITPYVTLASGLENGSASASFEVYTTETGAVDPFTRTIEDLGPNGTVTIELITESRNGATISFNYDRADAGGFKYSIDQGATWVITSSPTELSTLTSATFYNYWVTAYNADANGIITKTSFTTLAGVDAKPDAFTVINRAGVALSTVATPNIVIFTPVTVRGIDAATDAPASVSGDTGSKYRVSTDGGSTWGAWTTTPTNVRLNYQVQVQHDASQEYSSGGYDGVRSTTLNVGTTIGTFTSTTIADTTAPVISLQGGNLDWTQSVTWIDPGYTATDNADGTITGSVVVTGTVDVSTLGAYTLTYTSTDLSGNVAQTTRTVTVVVVASNDTTAPVITLTGGNITLTEGDLWVEPGFTALDAVSGDLTDSVVVSGAVNTAVPGPYTVTYSVSDEAGNITTATRTVTVVSAVVYPYDQEAPARRTTVANRYSIYQNDGQIMIMQPGEVLDFDYDLTDWLSTESDQIATSQYETYEISPALTVLGTGQVTGSDRIKVWLRAGDVVDADSSLVQLSVTTTGARRAAFQFSVLIINRMQ